MSDVQETQRPAGYLLLRERYALQCLPNHVESLVSPGTRRTYATQERTQEIYQKSYWPGDSDFDHLEFALKREGVHLQLLRALLPRLPVDALTAYVQSKPTSAYARRIWFLYEQFSGRRLELPDVTLGNYVDLLDPQEYYVGTPIRSSRHRVNVNLLGTFGFSPMIRRTLKLKVAEDRKVEQRCRKVIEAIPLELYARALQFLYTKETKSSYAIERETPDQKRAHRFAEALRKAAQFDWAHDEIVESVDFALLLNLV